MSLCGRRRGLRAPQYAEHIDPGYALAGSLVWQGSWFSRQCVERQAVTLDRSVLYTFGCRGSGPYPRHEKPEDSDLSASRLASILLTIPGSLAASAASVRATTHETLPPSGAVTVTVAKMGLPSLSGPATTGLPPSRGTRPCINSRRRIQPVAAVLCIKLFRFDRRAAHIGTYGWWRIAPGRFSIRGYAEGGWGTRGLCV